MAKKRTINEVREVLAAIPQQAAAWLLDRPVSALKDASNSLTRDENGCYNGQELVRWHTARSSTRDTSVPDADWESVLTLVEHLSAELSVVAPAVLDRLTLLDKRYGDSVLAEVVRMIVSDLRENGSPIGDAGPPDHDDQLLVDWALLQRDSHRETLARRELRIAVQCESCRAVRHGRKWHNRPIPASFVVDLDTCPTCTANATKAQ